MPNGATHEHCFETAISAITVNCVDAIRHSPALGVIREDQWPRSLSLSQRHLYLKDVLARLPTQPASRLEQLLPHRWQTSSALS
jgi:hypothetical protein